MALARRAARTGRPADEATADVLLDGWLVHLFGDRLAVVEEECAEPGSDPYAPFRDLDDDLWALLLSRQYAGFPNIRRLLPDLPDPDLQLSWNGAKGLDLLEQSAAFYRLVKDRYSRYAQMPLSDASVLDFGCGWGRLTRFFARDVAPGALLGCDPVEEILDVCRRSRVPAELHRCDFSPETLPIGRGVDLAFAFSVFTHLSEPSHEACLRALHAALNPGGLLVVTIRPPAYLRLDSKMNDALEQLGPDPLKALEEPRYVFVPHAAEPEHPQYEAGDMTYGETVISMPYVRERWLELFELMDVSVIANDLYQVAITLRRRD